MHVARAKGQGEETKRRAPAMMLSRTGWGKNSLPVAFQTVGGRRAPWGCAAGAPYRGTASPPPPPPPLPLNLANKQQQASNNKQQALLLTVLAIAPPHRSGLYSTLAILEPRWWPCQIQVLSQKLSGGGPGRGRQVGRCPPKSAQFWAKNSHFSPKTAPKPGRNAQTKGYGEYTARAA